MKPLGYETKNQCHPEGVEEKMNMSNCFDELQKYAPEVDARLFEHLDMAVDFFCEARNEPSKYTDAMTRLRKASEYMTKEAATTFGLIPANEKDKHCLSSLENKGRIEKGDAQKWARHFSQLSRNGAHDDMETSANFQDTNEALKFAFGRCLWFLRKVRAKNIMGLHYTTPIQATTASIATTAPFDGKGGIGDMVTVAQARSSESNALAQGKAMEKERDDAKKQAAQLQAHIEWLEKSKPNYTGEAVDIAKPEKLRSATLGFYTKKNGEKIDSICLVFDEISAIRYMYTRLDRGGKIFEKAKKLEGRWVQTTVWNPTRFPCRDWFIDIYEAPPPSLSSPTPTDRLP